MTCGQSTKDGHEVSTGYAWSVYQEGKQSHSKRVHD
jgi:hypothetical protein